MSTSVQLSGLASGFDWKSFVDQMMALEHAPADRLAAEKSDNTQKSNLLASLGTKLSTLQSAAAALKTAGLFGARTATVAGGAGWTAQAAADTAVGSYQITVAHLATAARRDGAADIGRALSDTADVSGLTLATLPIGTAVTAGTFTVNGRQVSVALSDSLADVFDAIASATGGEVTAAYNPAIDRVTLTGADGAEVMLGAANDTSNFLRALKLGNAGTDTASSTAPLGTLRTGAPLAAANLAAPLAGDPSAAHSFSINGVEIAYTPDTDSLATVMARINQSGAGVTASYDPVQDRMVLANAATGDLGIALSDDSGGLLAALGLTSGASFVRGHDAEFSINGGPTLTSASNVLDASVHGIAGLTLTATTADTQTVSVGADTSSVRSVIDRFITAFNEVQTFIDNASKVSTDSQGKVTAAALANNREVQGWTSSLRAIAFGEVPGHGAINRLESLGIDFQPGTSLLQVKDEDKLNAALRDHPADVAGFFQADTMGLVAKFSTFLSRVSADATKQQQNLTKANTSLDDQIAAIERRLEQQRSLLESAFINMETAQSTLQTQQAALEKAFSTSSK